MKRSCPGGWIQFTTWMIGFILVFVGRPLRSEDPSTEAIEYRRVFVPEKDLPLLSGEFVPLHIEELRKLIQQHQSHTNSSVDEATPRLIQLLLVASLAGQDLVSEASRFSMVYRSDKPAQFALVPCSLALRQFTSPDPTKADSISENSVDDHPSLWYDLNGQPALVVHSNSDYYLGWSLRGKSDQEHSRLRFEFEIPPCLDSQLLLQLPPKWRIESERCVARPVETPLELLGDVWPIPLENKSENWWSVVLSGMSHVDFDLVPSTNSVRFKASRLISRQRLDYRLLASCLEVVSEIQLADPISALPELVVRATPGLHINSIALNGRSMDWRPGDEPSTFQIVDPKLTENSNAIDSRQLVIRGLAAWPRSNLDTNLPTFQIDGEYTLDGKGSVVVHPDWEVNHIRSDQGRTVASNTPGQSNGLRRWEFEWTGVSPSIELLTSARKSLEQANVLTRLANDNDGLSATSWATFQESSIPRSTAHFSLSPGWTMESAQLSDRRYLASLQKSSLTENAEWEIHFTPPIVNQSISLELRTRLVSPAVSDNLNSANLTIDCQRPVNFQEIRQTDSYWIEPTGRYKIEANTHLLQARIDDKQLSDSQRIRLPRIGDVWLIRPDGIQLPRLTFRRQAAPYTVRFESIIAPSLDGVSATYRLRCSPLAGAVSAVTIDVNRLGDNSIRWRERKFGDDGDITWIDVESQRTRRGSFLNRFDPNSPDRMLRVTLQNATSESFELEGYTEFAWPSTESSDGLGIPIPLPTLPDAAQQEAILQIDKRLGISQWSEDAPWTPSGYTHLHSGWEARQFRYDPIQVTAVEILPTHNLQPSDAWLSDAVTKYQLHLDGQRELRLEGRLYPRTAANIAIELPPHWQYQSASLDDQAIDVSQEPDPLNRIRLWIPRHMDADRGVNLTLVIVGPQISVEHRAKHDLPIIQPSCQIGRHQYELWLPTVLSATTHAKRFELGIPEWKIDKLLPVQWSRLLLSDPSKLNSLLAENGSQRIDVRPATSSQTFLAWSSNSVSDATNQNQPVTIMVQENRQAERWILLFSGFALALCLGSISGMSFSIGSLVLVLGILSTGDQTLETLQLVALGWFIGFALRAIMVCMKQLVQPPIRHQSAIWFGGTAILSSLAAPDAAWAQSELSPVYHLVIPIDSNEEKASEVAYIPQSLLRKLYLEEANPFLNSHYRAAKYQLQLVESELGNAGFSAKLILNYEIDIRDLGQPIIWPLGAKYASFVSMRIDGSEIPLGSRLRWDDQKLQWTPLKRGLTRVELTMTPVVNRATNGHYSIAIDVVPVAGAELDIQASEITELQTNALGQVTNPTLNTYHAALGPVSNLSVDWRKTEKELRTSLPAASIESEFVLLKDSVLARSLIELEHGTFNANFFDIECDAAWQPLGGNLGSAILRDSIPASRNNRRRYRAEWRPHNGDFGKTRSVVIYWTSGHTDASLLNLPGIELPGFRTSENRIHYIRKNDSEWTFEGLRNWPVDDAIHRFDWYPQAGHNTLSHRKPQNSTTAFIRRASNEQSSTATIDSELRFLANNVQGKSTISWHRQTNRPSDLELAVPSGTEVTSVLIDREETPFSIGPIDQDHSRLQVFLQAPLRDAASVVVEFRQPYRELLWTTIPIPQLVGQQQISHRIAATRAIDRYFEWEGILPATGMDVANLPSPAEKASDQNALPLEVRAWTLDLPATLAAESKESNTNEPNSTPLLRYRVNRSTDSHPAQIVSQLTRFDDRWNFHAHGLVEAGPSTIDGVLLDIPQTIFESLRCDRRFASFASSEMGRQLIFIFSDQNELNSPFEFKIDSLLPPIESDSTTSLPEIRIMGEFEWEHWLMVPRIIDNQEAIWNFSGARVVEATVLPDFFKLQQMGSFRDFLVAIPTVDRPSIRLSNLAVNRLPIALNLILHELVMESSRLQKLTSTFLFTPRGHKSLQIRKAADLELVAVECNGIDLSESLSVWPINDSNLGNPTDSILELRLLSSSLPQKVTVHLARKSNAEINSIDPERWPQIVGARPEKTLVVVDSQQALTSDRWNDITENRKSEIIVNSVLRLVEQSIGLVSETPATDRIQWWNDWEAATSRYWSEAAYSSDQELLSQWSRRRLELREKCNATAPPDNEAVSSRSFLLDQSKLFDRTLRDTNMSNRKSFLLETGRTRSSNTIPSINVSEKADSSLSIKFWSLCWIGWILASTLALKYSHSPMARWNEAGRNFVREHPWWLLIGIGIFAFLLGPRGWLAPILVAIGFYLAVQACRRSISMKPVVK